MATLADPNKKNNMKHKDDSIGAVSYEQIVKNLNKEIVDFERELESIEKGRKYQDEQWAVEDELYRMKIDGFKPVPGTEKYVFEQNPRWWELQRNMIEFKYKEQKHYADAKKVEYDKREKIIKEQIQSIKDKLKDMESD